ncbi:MAG: hypothetical protein ACI9P7_000517 [Candidatus Azotimanducaceae bacterium]|jgi:uncharacterized protein (DUF2132 family)
MDNKINYQNNPLHSVGLKSVLNDLIDHYGFEILFAYLNINCFNMNPSLDSSIKFLKKTEWAREKVESFYLYQYKSLPRASDEQFVLPPRDRIIPDDEKPGEPAELSVEDGERLTEKRAQKAAAMGQGGERRTNTAYATRRKNEGRDKSHAQSQEQDSEQDSEQKQEQKGDSSTPDVPVEGKVDPWANARNRSKR